MSIKALKAHLVTKPEKQLLQEIVKLYQQFSVVRDFYDSQISTEGANDVLSKYKKIIRDEFLPKHGFGDARLSVARKAVMDFKKLNGLNIHLVDLAIYYVETGIKFTNMYGDINEPFYNSMESMFAQSMKWMKQLNVESQFQQRAAKICHDTDGIGWGFDDGLCEIYSDYFDD